MSLYRSVIITNARGLNFPGTRMLTGTISSTFGDHVPEARLVQMGLTVADPAKRRPAVWHRAAGSAAR